MADFAPEDDGGLDDDGGLEPMDEDGGDEIELLEAPDDGADGGPAENAERVTTRYMTKYEKARVLGTRALTNRPSSSAPTLVPHLSQFKKRLRSLGQS